MLNFEFMFPITFYRLLRRRSTTFWTKRPTDLPKLPRQSPQRLKPLSLQVWPQDNLIPLISLQKMMFRFIGHCPQATSKSWSGHRKVAFFSVALQGLKVCEKVNVFLLVALPASDPQLRPLRQSHSRHQPRQRPSRQQPPRPKRSR